MQNFTPISALIGGSLIGLSTVLLLWLNGRIAGVSGIFHGLFPPRKNEFFWRILFIIGLIVGCPLSLRFHTKVCSNFKKSDFNVPPQNKPVDDLLRCKL